MLEQGSYAPVDVATVIAVSTAGDSVAQALTDADGFFSLSVPDGEFILRVSALGYRPARAGPFVLDGEDAMQVAEVRVTPRPLDVDGLVVEADRSLLSTTGFFERMGEGRGQFLTPDAIAASEARTTPEVFYELDHVVPQWSRSPWERWVEFMGIGAGRCEPDLWIDGVRFRWRLPGEGLGDVVPIETLVAAEVYWGPFQAPLRFQGTATDNSCGVILLWTR